MSQYSYLHTTDMHTCLLTVMLISREQQANAGQWINTSLTPDPPDRQQIWGQKHFYFCSFHWLLGGLPLLLLPHVVYRTAHRTADWVTLVFHFQNISERFIKEHTVLWVFISFNSTWAVQNRRVWALYGKQLIEQNGSNNSVDNNTKERERQREWEAERERESMWKVTVFH